MADYLMTHKRYWLAAMLITWVLVGLVILWVHLFPVPHFSVGV